MIQLSSAGKRFGHKLLYENVHWLIWCALLLCLPAVGCSRDTLFRLNGHDRASLLKRRIHKDDEALARRCVDLLLEERFDELEDHLDPSLKTTAARGNLAEMAYLFPSKPISVKTVDATVVRRDGSSTTSITLEYEFPQSWLLARVVIRTIGGLKTISAFNVTPTTEPFEAMNEFSLNNKGFSQYACLLLALSVAAVMLYACVLCFRARIEHKWFWLAAMLVGVCRLTINWTTGQWSFSEFSVSLPPITASCSPYGPWMFNIASPIGAVVFLRLRKRLESAALPLHVVPEPEPAIKS